MEGSAQQLNTWLGNYDNFLFKQLFELNNFINPYSTSYRFWQFFVINILRNLLLDKILLLIAWNHPHSLCPSKTTFHGKWCLDLNSDTILASNQTSRNFLFQFITRRTQNIYFFQLNYLYRRISSFAISLLLYIS